MELIPLSPGFGVEVRGATVVDIAKDAVLYAALRAAFEEHSLLVFRGQQISDEIQLAYSRRFGPLEITKIGTVGAGTNLVHLTNLDAEGRIVRGDHKQALTAKANQLWHTDSSFKQVPALASVLSARIVPPSGGETEYASTRRAWDRLPVDRKAALADLTVHHSYEHSRGKIAAHLMSGEEKKALPPARWRLTWRNAANGRRSLYLASHAFAIDGMPETEAQRLLAALIDEATRPGSTYLHRWRPGDVVMWDNRATLHRGQGWPLDKPRYMVRTTISATDADGLASVRPAA
jgi:alpha-ketoglutarate-dependent 2,4-dichlorophenoxyacetate dioxygenase